MSKPIETVETLLRRSQWAHKRAMRAPLRSNERKKFSNQAGLVAACAREIEGDKALHKHLTRTHMTHRGWRALSDAVITYLRKKATTVEQKDD